MPIRFGTPELIIVAAICIPALFLVGIAVLVGVLVGRRGTKKNGDD